MFADRCFRLYGGQDLPFPIGIDRHHSHCDQSLIQSASEPSYLHRLSRHLSNTGSYVYVWYASGKYYLFTQYSRLHQVWRTYSKEFFESHLNITRSVNSEQSTGESIDSLRQTVYIVCVTCTHQQTSLTHSLTHSTVWWTARTHNTQ